MSGSFSVAFEVKMNPRALPALHAAIRRGLNTGLQPMVRSAARYSPYRTGNNARSIDWAVAGIKDAAGLFSEGAQDIRGAIYTGSGYGGILEIKTKPYIRTAVEEEATRLLGFIREEVRRAAA